MAMHLDHISISTTNLYYGAHRLRLETGLSFYDGASLQAAMRTESSPLAASHTSRSAELWRRQR